MAGAATTAAQAAAATEWGFEEHLLWVLKPLG